MLSTNLFQEWNRNDKFGPAKMRGAEISGKSCRRTMFLRHFRKQHKPGKILVAFDHYLCYFPNPKKVNVILKVQLRFPDRYVVL